MSLTEMIEQAAGSGALGQIGARVGLTPEQVQAAIAHLGPALAPGLATHAATAGGGLPGGGAPTPGSDEAEAHGRSVLGSILGSKDASRSVAADAAQATGIDVGQLKALLPQIASVAAQAMAARGGGGGGGLGGMLGGILGQARA